MTHHQKTEGYVDRLRALDTCAVSDALDGVVVIPSELRAEVTEAALEKPLDLPMLLPDRLFGEVTADGPGPAG